jgi:protein-tyrosine-phosphatase/DNA-binding HxlR family transcriptional regulator
MLPAMDAPVDPRVTLHAALADPARLAIVDELVVSDRAPVELRRMLGLESNLLAHHLDVLEDAGLVSRTRSSGDGRRRYVHLLPGALADLVPGRPVAADGVLFVCTHNSARSQLAAALWRDVAGGRAGSAGTHPAARVHPGAIAAAQRAGLDLAGATPRSLDRVAALPELVVTVCDQAHEELAPRGEWLHWSIPDPVPDGSPAAFDAVVEDLRRRIDAVAVGVTP